MTGCLTVAITFQYSTVTRMRNPSGVSTSKRTSLLSVIGYFISQNHAARTPRPHWRIREIFVDGIFNGQTKRLVLRGNRVAIRAFVKYAWMAFFSGQAKGLSYGNGRLGHPRNTHQRISSTNKRMRSAPPLVHSFPIRFIRGLVFLTPTAAAGWDTREIPINEFLQRINECALPPHSFIRSLFVSFVDGLS